MREAQLQAYPLPLGSLLRAYHVLTTCLVLSCRGSMGGVETAGAAQLRARAADAPPTAPRTSHPLPSPYHPRTTHPLLTVPVPPAHLPLEQSPLTSLPQAAEAAHEARLHAATQELEAELCISDAELRALEAALLASEARHVEQLRQQRRCMLVAVGCLLARRRLVLAPRDVGAAYAPYAAQSAATGLRSEGGWADGRGAR